MTQEINCNETITAVIDVPCPKCEVPAGAECQKIRHGRNHIYSAVAGSSHRERVDLFMKLRSYQLQRNSSGGAA